MFPLVYPAWLAAAEAANLASQLAPSNSKNKLLRSLAMRAGVLNRISQSAARRDKNKPLIWLHAPSVGEGLQAAPVIQQLRKRFPSVQLAWTWFSPSANKLGASMNTDFQEILPFDGKKAARILLDSWQPSLLVFVKLDVWPVLAETAHQSGVPTALISATLAPNSSRSSPLARAFLKDAYSSLSSVGAISSQDAERLTKLGVHKSRIRVTGDTRMDQVLNRADSVGPDHPVRSLITHQNAQVLVAGSTWPADENVLLPAVSKWLKLNAQRRLIIAPHEPSPSHLENIRKWASSSDTTLQQLSQLTDYSEFSQQVLLVDKMGVLGDLYSLGTLAFVGGGFHRAGLHSVLEPAAFGLPVLFGPGHHNAREAGMLIEKNAAASISECETLSRQLEQLSTNTELRLQMGNAARALVLEERGSTDRVIDLFKDLIPEALSD